MKYDPRVEALIREATVRRYDRRTILRRAALLGLSAPAVAMVLAACRREEAAPAQTPVPAQTPAPGQTPAPAASPTPAAEVTGGIVNVINTLGDKQISNPILTGNDYWCFWLTFSRLVKYDDHGNLIPELAESWDYSPDGLTLTFHLVEATWHDGTPFTADDVIFTFEKIKDEKTQTTLGSRLQVGGEWVTWSAPDPRTVVITTKEPFAPFLFSISQIGIIPKHLLENSSDINTDPFNTKPIGTGPFKVVEWNPDQWIRFERFDNYFKGRPAADGWTAFFMADTNAGAAALERGEVDMMFVPPEMQPRYENDPNVMLLNYVYYTPITLAFNHKHPILKDLNVRKAIAHAIDKKSLTDTVTKGRGLLAENQYAVTGPLDKYNDYDNVNYSKEYPYNPELAKKILDDAGWTPGPDGIRRKDGQRMSFTLLTYSGFDEYKNDQVILQQMLGAVGIEIVPQVLEYTTLESMWYNPNDDPMGRAMEVQEWPHPFEQDPDVYNELHSASHPPNGDNYMYFKDDEVDRLIALGRTTVDEQERIKVYHQLDQARLKTLPALPLYCAVDGWIVRRVIGGVPEDTPSIRWYHRAFPEKIYKKQQ